MAWPTCPKCHGDLVKHAGRTVCRSCHQAPTYCFCRDVAQRRLAE